MSNPAVKKTPERKCVGCSEKKAKNELIRIVRLPDEKGVELDRTGKKSGRGAYICPSAACLKKAKKRLEANLECKIPDEVFEKLEKEIEGEHS
ncbi:MAG: YlxR family protein [Clostridia bacterium]|nr:YlxR family protein [Clostridia bacterium]MBP3554026.1 YlxR family protein [Clostridia bacterium]MBQ8420111.1 YlxR family protein [Clostridia bacterium]